MGGIFSHRTCKKIVRPNPGSLFFWDFQKKKGLHPSISAMETFNKLSEELQGMVAEHLNGGAPLHTPAQRELFCSLPPDLQRKVLTDAFTSDDVRDSYNRMCRPSSGCQLRFSLYGFFHWPGALEECDHYRLHGMCSRCKEKNDRRLARRRERLRGRALLQQAWMNDDERAIDEHWH